MFCSSKMGWLANQSNPPLLSLNPSLLKKGLQVITFSSYKVPSRPRFQKLHVNLSGIKQINEFLVSTFCFSLRSKSWLQVYRNGFRIENTQVHKYYRGKSNNLHKRFNRTNLGVYSARNKVINIWKTIPHEIKQSISIKVFKKLSSSYY